jgi:hypothetical protein
MLLEISGTFFGGSVKHLFFLQFNVEGISVSSLRTIILYATDSNRAENSVQNEVL